MGIQVLCNAVTAYNEQIVLFSKTMNTLPGFIVTDLIDENHPYIPQYFNICLFGVMHLHLSISVGSLISQQHAIN